MVTTQSIQIPYIHFYRSFFKTICLRGNIVLNGLKSRFRPASVSPCSKKEIIVKYGKDNGSERMECTATVR